jgi:tryptophan halogenase
MTDNKIKHIVILGGGTAGWMSAAALAKVMGTQKYTITLIESEMIGTVGVGEATIPMLQLYNQVLQLDEDEFVRETNATFKLGIEFVNWRNEGHTYFHPFGLIGTDMDGISFTHFWMRWMRSGGTVDYSKFNAETEAARAGKFGRTPPPPSTLPQINYAFHFDAGLYAAYLRRYAEKRGAVRVEGLVRKVEQHPETGFVTALELKDGRKIKGDLFLDCSGFRGVLIEETLKSGYEDWSKWLPCNAAAAMPCEKVGPPTPFTRSTAREAGWQWRIPLQHRTGNGYVFCNSFISEDEACEKLSSRLDGPATAQPRVLRFVTGRRRTTWNKNVIALGLAGGFLEPLESTSIHLVQVVIAKLLNMFPKAEINPHLVARFNSEMEAEYVNVKDFLIAHYKVTEREETEFWKYCKNMEIPDSLAARLDIFKGRGQAMAGQTELFKEVSWFAVLVGQGLMPENYHPVADVIPEDQLKLRLSKVRSAVQERVNGMPMHQDFIDRNCAAKPAAAPVAAAAG